MPQLERRVRILKDRRHIGLPDPGWEGRLLWLNPYRTPSSWEEVGQIWEPTWSALLKRALAYVRTGEPDG